MADFDKNLQPIIKSTGYTPTDIKLNAAAAPGISFPSAGGVSDLSQEQDVFSKLKAASAPTTPKALFVSNAELDANKRYKFFNPTIGDYEDFAAQGQEWYKQATNGVLKGANLAATTVAGGFGTLYGVGKAILPGGKFSDIFQNDVMTSLDKWNNYVDNELLPNYYTAAERNSEWYSRDNWLTWNFVFDKLIKNSGFAVGAMVGGNIANAGLIKLGSTIGNLAAKGAVAAEASQAFKLFTPLLRNTSRAFSAGKNMEAAALLEGRISSIADLTAKSSELAKIAKQTGEFAKFSDTARRTAVAAYSSAGEASFEALQTSKEYRDNLIEKFRQEKGFEPTGEELIKIDREAAQVGKTSFLGNMALLAITEYAQLPYLIGSNYSSSRQAANSLLGEVDEVVLDATGKYVSKNVPKTRFGKIYDRTKTIGSYVFDPKESAQEILQYGLQVGTQNYFKKAQESGDADFFVDGFLYGLFGKDEYGEGVGALVSKEGIEGGLLGGITGGAMQALSGIGRNKAITKNTESFLNMLNDSPTFKDAFKEKLEYANRGIVLQQQERDAILNGDKLEATDLRYDQMHTYLAPRIKYGRFDMVMEDLGELEQAGMTAQGLAELKQQGMANINDTVESFQKRLSSIKSSAKALNDMYQSLNIRYAGETVEVDGEKRRKYSPLAIDMLAYAGSKIANYDVRIPELNAKLVNAGINTQAILNDIITTGTPNVEATKEALETINSMSVTSDVKDQLKGQLDDVIELSLRRKMFIEEFDGIKNNPLNYERPEKELDEVDVRQKEGRKKIEKTLEVGKTYSLEEPIRLEKGKLVLAPKFTVLSSTLGGEFEVQLPDGTNTFFSPEQFDQYKITEEENASQELEDILNQSIDDVFNYPAFKNVVEKPGEDVNKLQYLNSLGNDKLTKAVLNRFNKLAKNLIEQKAAQKETAQKIQDQSAEINKQQEDVADNANDPKVVQIEFDTRMDTGETGPMKSAAQFFNSGITESDDPRFPNYNNNPAPHIVRQRVFLNRAKSNPKRSKFRAITFTYNQEKDLGLSGITQLSYGKKWEANKDKVNDEIDGFVAQVYVEVDGKNRYFIDQNGNRIKNAEGKDTKVGEQVDLAQVVFDARPTAREYDSTGSDRFRTKEKDEFLARMEIWKEQRKILFGMSANDLPTNAFMISKGFAIVTPKKDGKYIKNKVGDTLINESQIETEVGLLKISTGTPIVHSGENIPAKPGMVYVQYKDTLQVLNNNLLGAKKGKTVYEVIKSLIQEMESQASAGKEVKLDRQKLIYLRSVLNYSKPDGEMLLNQLWIDVNSMSVKIGKQSYAFNEFTKKEADIVSTLSNTYHTANKRTLDKNEPYFEFVFDNGKLDFVKWANYQSYLISGENRSVDDIPFVTNVAKPSDAVPYNYRGKYSTLINFTVGEKNTNFIPVEKKEEEPPVAPPVEQKSGSNTPSNVPETLPAMKAGKYSLNDGSLNTDEVSKQDIEFVATLDSEEQPDIEIDFEREKNKKALDELSKIVTEEKLNTYRTAIPWLNENSSKEDTVKEFIRYQLLRKVGKAIIEQQQAPAPPAPEAPVSDIEAKKADIERRRQEELEAYKLKKDGTPKNENELTKVYAIEDVKNINAKYDAELAALEGKPVAEKKTENVQITRNFVELETFITDFKPQIQDLFDNPTVEKYYTAVKNLEFDLSADLPSERLRARIEAQLRDIKKSFTLSEKTKPSVEKPAPPAEEPSAPKSKKGRMKSGYDDARAASRSEYTADKMSERDIEIFKAWWKKNVPNIPFEILDNIITLNDGRKAWGVFENGVAKFFKRGLRGTEYHEIFEGIWKGFLSSDERQVILDEFKNQPGDFLDRESGKRISFAEATDQQAKERIADDFADYRLGKLPAKSLSERIRRFFKAIVDFFKSFVSKPSLKDELFDAIDSGKFKDAVLPESIKSAQPEYRIALTLPDGEMLTEDEAWNVVQDMTLTISGYILNRQNDDTIGDVFDLKKVTGTEAYNYVRKIYQERGNLDFLGDKVFNELFKRNIDYLKTVGVSLDADSLKTINDENGNNRLYSPEAFEVDFKKNMKFAIKYLISTLPAADKTEKNENGVPRIKTGAMDLPVLANFNKTFATLLSKISNTSFEKIPEKLFNLFKEDGNYYRVVRALNGNMDAEQAGELFDFEEFSDNDWKLYIQFIQSFNKSKADAVFESRSVDPDEVRVLNKPAERASAINVEKYSWLSNIKTLASQADSMVGRNKLNYFIDAEHRNYPKQLPSTNADRLTFLRNIGINFPAEAIPKDEKGIKSFIDAVNSIYRYGSKNIATVAKFTEADSSVSKLAEIYVNSLNPDHDTTRFNAENKRTGNYSDSNAVSVFEEIFNESNTVEELLARRPELADEFSKNSLFVKKGGPFFDKNGVKRPGAKLRIGVVDGMMEDDGGTTVANLTEGHRFTLEINQNLQGNYYILIPADSSTERTYNIGNQIKFADINTAIGDSELFSIMESYLDDEIDLALDWRNRKELAAVGEKRAKQLRFFREILSPELVTEIENIIGDNRLSKKTAKERINKILSSNKSAIQQSIKDTVSYLNGQLDKKLRDTGEVVNSSENAVQYLYLDSDFAEKNGIDKRAMSLEDYDRLLTFLNINQMIANTELHKFIFGDPYQFITSEDGNLEATKRFKSWLSPRRKTFTSESFDKFLNNNYNKVTEALSLSGSDITRYNFNSSVKTVTLKDPTPASRYASQFAGYKESDGFSLIQIGAFREVKLKNAEWPKEAEKWYQWQMAYTRQKLSEMKKADGKAVYSYEKNTALEKHDKELIKKPEPYYVLEVLKPIVSGAKPGLNRIEGVIDKFSQMPLFFKAVEGTHLQDLYVQMLEDQVGYVVYKSGRKEGVRATHNVYNGNGTFNSSPFETNSIEEIAWSTYGIQVENSYEENKSQTRGSQLMKNASMDMFENGKAVMQGAEKLYDDIVKTHNEFHEFQYQQFLNKLGIEDLGTKFVIKDAKKVSETLEYELLRREASENVIDTIRLDANGQFRIPFEASSAYEEIRSVLFSIINKSLISPSMGGKSYVQVPATMWENRKEGRKLVRKIGDNYVEITKEQFNALSNEDKKSVSLASDTLKFYENEDGKRHMEVMIPNYWKKYFKGMTDEEVLKYLNKPENQKILFGVGFRIPHQAASSTEIIKVKGFLHPSMGSTVVVPSEIVAKAGSDFDIDKLNMYLKSVYLDENKNARLIEYKGSKDDTIAFYRNVYDRKFQIQLRKLTRYSNFRRTLIQVYNLLDTIADEDYYGENIKLVLGDKLYDFFINHEDLIEEIQEQADDKNLSPSEYIQEQITRLSETFKEVDAERLDETLKTEYANRMYKKSLENRYFDLLEQLVTIPENFTRLMAPVSDAGLPDVAKELDKARKDDEAGVKNKLLSKSFMTSLRHAFVLGKKWVGIAAVNITGHSIAQKINAYLDPRRLTSIDKYDASFLGNMKLSVPHNTVDVDGEKYISLGGRTVAYAKKDKEGKDTFEFISDRLSGYATAFVDVAKDPYVMKILRSDLVVGTAMFMERIGSGELSAYFLNQPIIIDYLKYLDRIGSRALFSKNNIAEAYMNYPVESGKSYDLKDLFPVGSDGMVDFNKSKSNLLELINVDTKRDADFNLKQHAIFKEFLKLSKMAQFSFKFSQAYNYDTTRVSTAEGVLKKSMKTQTAEDANIISSINDVFTQTFIGKQKEMIFKEVKSLSAVFKLDEDVFNDVIEEVLKPFTSNEYMPADDFDRVVKKVKTAMIDYIVQNKSALLSKEVVNGLLIGKNNIGVQLANLQKKYPTSELLSNLETRFSRYENGGVTVTLKAKPTDAVTTNRYIGFMRELKSMEPEFYNNLVLVSLLQGTYNTRVAINKIIPLEDRANIIAPLINSKYSLADLQKFSRDGVFFRTNFSDEAIVPTYSPRFERRGDDINYSKSGFIKVEGIEALPGNGKILKLSKQYARTSATMDFIKVKRYQYIKGFMIDITGERENVLWSDFKELVKNGEVNKSELVGYKKVKDVAGDPLEDEKGNVYFKMVNLYGDGDIAKIYKVDGLPSSLENGTYKVKKELSDDIVVRAVNNESVNLPDEDTGETIDLETELVSNTVAPSQQAQLTVDPSTVKRSYQFQPDNIEKIKNGTKNITNRKDAVADGMYKLSDGTIVNLTSLGRFKVIPGKEGVSILDKSGKVIGSMPLNEFAQREGFSNWEDFKANNKYSDNFINNGQIRFVYSIDLVQPSVGVTQVEAPVTKQEPVIETSNKVERSERMINRSELRANPKTLYLFGDNDARKGLGGQAKEMRNEPNAIGISTKKLPATSEQSYKTDAELESNKTIITNDINKVIAAWDTGKYEKLVIPQMGVGLAELPTRAPQTYEFLQQELQRLENYVNGIQEPTSQVDANAIVKSYNIGDYTIYEYGDGTFDVNHVEDGIIADQRSSYEEAMGVITRDTAERATESPVLEPFTDSYKYYGRFYEIAFDSDGNPVDVIGYKGSASKKQQLLDAYIKNPNVDPQNDKPFRSEELPPQQEEEQPTKANEFRFKDGTVIETGNIILNDQQKEALQLAVDAINRGQTKFVLRGYAGTGKSTISKFIREYLQKSNSFKSIVYSSPTHKANTNLLIQLIRGKIFNQQPVTTASLLNKIIGEDRQFIAGPKDKMPWSGVLIVDESSMIDAEDYNLLVGLAKRKGTSIIFMGDPAQLPPVKSSQLSKALQFTSPEEGVELTQVMRQKGDNPLLDILTNIRQNLTSIADRFSFKTSVNGKGEGVEFTKDYVKFNEKILQFFSSAEYKDDPTYAKIMTYTNSSVANYNNMIQAQLGISPYGVGSVMMGYEQYGTTPNVHNGQDYKILESKYVTDRKVRVFEGNVGNKYFNIETNVSGYSVKMRRVFSKEDEKLLKDVGQTALLRPVEVFIINPNDDRNIEFMKQVLAFKKVVNDKTIPWRLRQDPLREFESFFNTYQLPADMIEYKGKITTLPKLKEENPELFRPNRTTGKSAFEELSGVDKPMLNKNIDYGYAVTSHKGQGSTYQYVFVDYENMENPANNKFIMDGADKYAIERQQLKYVGLSRASKIATVFSRKADTEAIMSQEEILPIETVIPESEESFVPWFTESDAGESASGVKNFYQSLTPDQKLKLGSLESIIEEYNMLPAEISESVFIDILTCRL